jgi:hypothetical protein
VDVFNAMAVDTVEIRPIDIMSNQNGWNHLPNAQDKNNLNLNHNYVTLLQQQQQHIQLRMPPDNSLYAWDSDNHRIVNQHHQQQDSCSSSSGLDLTAESEKNDNHAEVLPSNNKSNVNVKQNQTDLIQESLRQLYQNLQEQQQNSSRWSPLSVNDITVFDTQTSGNNINNERSNLQNIHIPSGSFLTGSGVEPSTCNTTSDIEDGMRFELFEDTLGACPGAKTATVSRLIACLISHSPPTSYCLTNLYASHNSSSSSNIKSCRLEFRSLCKCPVRKPRNCCSQICQNHKIVIL